MKSRIKFNKYQALLFVVIMGVALLIEYGIIVKLPRIFRLLFLIAYSIWLNHWNPFKRLDTWLKKHNLIEE